MCDKCHDTGVCFTCQGTGLQMRNSVVIDGVCPKCGGDSICYCVWRSGTELSDNSLRSLQRVLGNEEIEYVSMNECDKDFVLFIYWRLEAIQTVFDTDSIEGYIRLLSGNKLYAYKECGDNILIARTDYHG